MKETGNTQIKPCAGESKHAVRHSTDLLSAQYAAGTGGAKMNKLPSSLIKEHAVNVSKETKHRRFPGVTWERPWKACPGGSPPSCRASTMLNNSAQREAMHAQSIGDLVK